MWYILLNRVATTDQARAWEHLFTRLLSNYRSQFPWFNWSFNNVRVHVYTTLAGNLGLASPQPDSLFVIYSPSMGWDTFFSSTFSFHASTYVSTCITHGKVSTLALSKHVICDISVLTKTSRDDPIPIPVSMHPYNYRSRIKTAQFPSFDPFSNSDANKPKGKHYNLRTSEIRTHVPIVKRKKTPRQNWESLTFCRR